MVADDPDPAAGDFTASSEQLAARVSADYQTGKTYLQTQDTASARSDVLAGFASGCSLMSYVGHSAQQQFAGWSQTLLTQTDVGAMVNASNPPILIIMGCDFARLDIPGYDSIGEMLVTGSGGAAAVFAAVGHVFNSESVRIGDTFFREVFQDHAVRIGDAVLAAWREYPYPGALLYHVESYEILGDPAMVLARAPYNYATWLPTVFSASQLQDPTVVDPVVDPDSDGLANLVEFIMGMNPTNALAVPEFTAGIENLSIDGPAADYVTVTVNRRKWLEGVELRVEVCSSLDTGQWSSGGGVVELLRQVDMDGEIEAQTFRVIHPLQSGDRLYVRLRWVETGP